MLKKLRALLPKRKTEQELDEHYRRMEELQLEKGDFTAMLIAAFITIGLPLLVIVGALYGLIYLAFV